MFGSVILKLQSLNNLFSLSPAAALKPSDYLLMWFYLGVEFPQDSNFPKFLHFTKKTPHSTSLSHLHLFLPLFIATSLSPFTVRLLRYIGPTVPHIIISENTHTQCTYCSTDGLHGLFPTDEQVNIYLPRLSFFHSHPSIPPIIASLSRPPCHTSFFSLLSFSGIFCPNGLAFVLSRGALTGICCANTLAYTCTYFENMMKRMAVCIWKLIHTCMHIMRASANKELIIIGLKTMACYMKLNSTH